MTTTRNPNTLCAMEACSKEGVVTMKRHLTAVGLTAMLAFSGSCGADTILDWDAKAGAVASFAALGEREVAIVDLAMFDAVNSVARADDKLGGPSSARTGQSRSATPCACCSSCRRVL